jgi:hypothetical protein
MGGGFGMLSFLQMAIVSIMCVLYQLCFLLYM